MNKITKRQIEIASAVEKIRSIEKKGGVTRRNLEKMKQVLLMLAKKRELFPLNDFLVNPTSDGNSAIYRLSEDDDNRFALYASAALPGKGVHPHNHTTWAIIVGLHGEEHNIFYERTDDLSFSGKGQLKEIRRLTVSPGMGTTLMPDDIHSIYTSGEKQTVHLHMYGVGLEQLHHRVVYNTKLGTYKKFPVSVNIKKTL